MRTTVNVKTPILRLLRTNLTPRVRFWGTPFDEPDLPLPLGSLLMGKFGWPPARPWTVLLWNEHEPANLGSNPPW